MHEVYKFFGFGKKFIEMMETLGNNRFASIILEDGSLSERFTLGKGRPQGDPPSPLQYNLAEQILLFKLELSNITPLIQAPVVAVAGPAQLPVAGVASTEANRETSTADGFADDTTVSTYCTYEDLSLLKQILEEFGVFSGLKCNLEKSFMMRVGSRQALPEAVRNLGFTEANSIQILGLDIDFNLDCLSSLHDITIKKLQNWQTFGRDLTFLYPAD